MSDDTPLRLTARIFKATHKGHQRTDRTAQLRSVTVLRDPLLYRQMLRDFWVVYRSFERAWQQVLSSTSTDANIIRAKSILSQINMPEVSRTASFEADIEYYYADDARALLEQTATDPSTKPTEVQVADKAIELADASISAPARAYEAHIYEMTLREPLRLIAYIYTMYSALTAGGQILRMRLVRHLLFFSSTQDEETTPPRPRSARHPHLTLNGQQIFDFYPVEGAASNAPEDVWRNQRPIERMKLRTELKRRLDALPLTEEEIASIIDEAHGIFRRNAELMNETTAGTGWRLVGWIMGLTTLTGASIAFLAWLVSHWQR